MDAKKVICGGMALMAWIALVFAAEICTNGECYFDDNLQLVARDETLQPRDPSHGFVNAYGTLEASGNRHAEEEEEKGPPDGEVGHPAAGDNAQWQEVQAFLAGRERAAHGEALQLLKPSSNHDRLEIEPAALAVLESIEEPVAMVAAVGPYHGGKSFLLNVLLNSSQGFPVGTRPEPETLGIWLRALPPETLCAADGSRVVLLDTEGLYGQMASMSYDAKVFAVATLLSSHLVYNTLRTLGDASSVSALADLAKHAQVFNLHNWLHTGQLSSPLGGDGQHPTPNGESSQTAELLLQTLEFPPLTWVVQGFDISLDPAESPLQYLQRYFAAHASTGDRSLDELFDKGVECLPMRTPVDMNRLREEVGGGGLGEHAELFPLLHPAYKEDVQKVRKSVLGKLRAKGEPPLTGKAVAKLLPFLVHYLNEDFPLNAEKPLRQTITELLLQSGLEGGAAFFRLKMDKALGLPRDNKSISREKEGPKEREARLSALVKAAFTPKELAIAMIAAEQQAAEYCRRRCVGVIPSMVQPYCGVALSIRIQKLKPGFDVKEALVGLAEGLQDSVQAELAELKLPMPEGQLDAATARLLKKALQSYEAGVGKHRGGDVYSQHRARLQADIKYKSNEVAATSARYVSSLLSKGQEAFHLAYSQALQAGDKQGNHIEGALESGQGRLGPLPPKKLQQLHAKAVEEASQAFLREVGDGGLSWVGPGHKQFEFHRFENIEWAKQRFGELQAANNARVAQLCCGHSADLLSQFQRQIQHFQPFPDNDESLAAKLNDLSKELLSNYSSRLAPFAGLPPLEAGKQELLTGVDLQGAELREKNTRLMTALCYEPLQKAKRELKMHECQRTYRNIFQTGSWWSPRCLLPAPRLLSGGFYSEAYRAAQHYLDNAQPQFQSGSRPGEGEGVGAIVLSPATRNKVIQSWIEHDLGLHARDVTANFAILVSMMASMVSLLWWQLATSGPILQPTPPSIRNTNFPGRRVKFEQAPVLQAGKRTAPSSSRDSLRRYMEASRAADEEELHSGLRPRTTAI